MSAAPTHLPGWPADRRFVGHSGAPASNVRRIDAPTPEDRGAIVSRVTLTLIGLAIMGACEIAQRLGSSAGDLIAMMRACAAILIAAPLLVRTVHETWGGGPDVYSNQLVCLAVLAAVATGETWTAMLLPLIVETGHVLEDSALRGSRLAGVGVLRLLSLRATVLASGTESDVASSDLRAGDMIVVRPGEIVAADGTVIAGQSAVEEQAITGESIPRDVGQGDFVPAGGVNLTGCLHLRVAAASQNSMLGRIIAMLSDASEARPPFVQRLEKLASGFLPGVLLLCGISLYFTHDIDRAISVLVVSCPCALLMAAPAAMISAISAGARRGVVIKNQRFLSPLFVAQTVVFDKTGTMTGGELELSHVCPAEGVSEVELIEAAGACARGSRHPVARAVARHAGLTAEIDSDPIFREWTGQGITCQTADHALVLGKPEWVRSLVSGEFGSAFEPRSHAHPVTVVAVACDQRLLGYLEFADQIRPEATSALAELRVLGFDRFVLLTGDRASVAMSVGETLGFDEIRAQLSPEAKRDFVLLERDRGSKVMVVGDGINDLPMLRCGDVGMAFGGSRADAAFHAADIAILTGDLRTLPWVIRLARAAQAVIVQNLVLGVASVIVMVALAITGWLSPLAGAVIHNIGAVLVLANSARLLRISAPTGAEPRRAHISLSERS